jgi:hypothetical protein
MSALPNLYDYTAGTWRLSASHVPFESIHVSLIRLGKKPMKSGIRKEKGQLRELFPRAQSIEHVDAAYITAEKYFPPDLGGFKRMETIGANPEGWYVILPCPSVLVAGYLKKRLSSFAGEDAAEVPAVQIAKGEPSPLFKQLQQDLPALERQM